MSMPLAVPWIPAQGSRTRIVRGRAGQFATVKEHTSHDHHTIEMLDGCESPRRLVDLPRSATQASRRGSCCRSWLDRIGPWIANQQAVQGVGVAGEMLALAAIHDPAAVEDDRVIGE